MSNRVTIFDKNTGKHLRTGGAKDPKSQDLIAQGHIVVEGSYNDNFMWDFVNGVVIPDDAKNQAAADRRARKEMLAQRRVSNLADLMTRKGKTRSSSQINADIDLILEYMEKI